MKRGRSEILHVFNRKPNRGNLSNIIFVLLVIFAFAFFLTSLSQKTILLGPELGIETFSEMGRAGIRQTDQITGEMIELIVEEEGNKGFSNINYFQEGDVILALDNLADSNLDFAKQDTTKSYFVVFEEPSILEKKKEITRRSPILQAFSASDVVEEDKEVGLEEYKGELKNSKKIAKNKVLNKISQLRNSQGDFSISAASAKRGGQIASKEFELTINALVVDLEESEIEQIENLEGVKGVYPDETVYASLEDSVGIINADDLWDFGVDGEGMVIGVIDTGIDYTHPILGRCTTSEFLSGTCEKVIGGYDFYNGDADPMDDHYHGTHCAGIVAGDSPSIKGVAPKAKLYAYKVLGSGGSGSMSDVVDAIEASIDPNGDGDYSDHLDVISLSLGSWGADPDSPSSLALDRAMENGVIAVVAAGNSGPNKQTIGNPGASRKAITVAASCKPSQIGALNYCSDGPIASFSSRGPVIKNEKVINKPDIAAPGVKIHSSVLNDGYKQLSGTSMATPHVAGAVALLKQLFPDWTPEEIKARIKDTAIDLGEDQDTQGAGLLDLAAAAGISEGMIKILASPHSAKFVINPVASEIQDSKSYVLKNIAEEDMSLDISTELNNIAVDASTNVNSLTILANSEETLELSVVVDIDLIESNILYTGVIILEDQASSYVLRLPFSVFVKERLESSDLEFDLGLFLPSETSWSSQKTIQLTNLRNDLSTEYSARVVVDGYKETSGGSFRTATDIEDNLVLS